MTARYKGNYARLVAFHTPRKTAFRPLPDAPETAKNAPVWHVSDPPSIPPLGGHGYRPDTGRPYRPRPVRGVATPRPMPPPWVGLGCIPCLGLLPTVLVGDTLRPCGSGGVGRSGYDHPHQLGGRGARSLYPSAFPKKQKAPLAVILGDLGLYLLHIGVWFICSYETICKYVYTLWGTNSGLVCDKYTLWGVFL